jgi:hypothetical protein
MNELQKRRIKSQLMISPPGFSDPIVEMGNDRACVLFDLADSSAVDADYITAYRRCLLVELDDTVRSKFSLASLVCKSIKDFGNAGIATLLGNADDSIILRILNLESHSVVQLIGSSEASDTAVNCLVEKGIRRVHDVREIPQEITRLRV